MLSTNTKVPSYICQCISINNSDEIPHSAVSEIHTKKGTAHLLPTATLVSSVNEAFSRTKHVLNDLHQK
jgi:V8-like Glu-specific endopeptidase